ncbi:hypothetical protein TKK_0005373 [Trichogramma kaykai]
MEETVIVKSYPTHCDWLISEYIIRKKYASSDPANFFIKSPTFLCVRKKEWYLQLHLKFNNYDLNYSYDHRQSAISVLTENENEKLDFSGSFISILLSTGKESFRLSNVQVGKKNYFPESCNIYSQLKNYLSKGQIIIRFLINARPLNETSSLLTYECSPISLANLYNNPSLSDIQLIVGKETFYAHKAILANRSPVFTAMFQIEMEEKRGNIVEIKDLSAAAVQGMLSFIYMNKVLIEIDTVDDLLKASDKYEIIDLKNLCGKYLMNILDIKNCIKIVSIAELFNMQELKISAINFIVSISHHVFEMQEIDDLAVSNMDLHLEITKSCFKYLHFMMRKQS